MGTPDLRSILAPNPGPFTLEGTRTYLVGRRRVAVIDPGPDRDDHLRALLSAVEDAEGVTLVLTHGHADHVAAVDPFLAARPETRVVGAGHPRARPLAEGEGVETDAGPLRPVPTPGHTRDHLVYLWEPHQALFAGDMILGRGDTTWVGEYPGCVADYLSSLARLRTLPVRTIHPTHGPDLHDPGAVWDRYEDHRRRRIAGVRAALSADGGLGLDAILERVYGDSVPHSLHNAALRSLAAMKDYVESHPEVEGGADTHG